MLLYAVYRRAPRVVEALLLLKADANASDKYGVTPLMLAAHQADATGTRIVRDILRHAAGYVLRHLAALFRWCVIVFSSNIGRWIHSL